MSVNSGSNDDAETILRKHLSPGFAQTEKGWSALIAALAAGDETNFENSVLAWKQLYKSSASGIYLDRRCSDDGIIRPNSVGIGDDVFRRLAVKTTTKKLVAQALLEVLEVYYGTDSTRAHSVATAAAPYSLSAGWELLLSIDAGTPVVIPFVAADFSSIGAATAQEVAAVITRWLRTSGSGAYALESIDPDTGAKRPCIYSGSLGLESSVQVLGGRAQNVLQFQQLLTRSEVSTSWVVTLPLPGKVRFKITGTTTTDLSSVQIGDYVNIFGTGFNAGNRGTWGVTAVDVRYNGGTLEQFFEVLNLGAVAQGGVTAVTSSDLMFFRGVVAGVNDNGVRAVLVAQTQPQEVDIQLPATTIAVQRSLYTGAYAVARPQVEPTNVVRRGDGVVTLTTATPHGLSVDTHIILDDVLPGGVAAPVSAGTSSTTDAGLTTLWSSASTLPGVPTHNAQALTLADGRVFVAGGHNYDSSGPTDHGVITGARLFSITSNSTLADGSRRYGFSWSGAAAVPAAREYHRLSLLTDTAQGGNVLLSGGWDAGAAGGVDGFPLEPPLILPGVGVGAIDLAYLYNVGANTWSGIEMNLPHAQHCAVTLADGRVLVAGGAVTETVTTAACELFTPSGAGGDFTVTGFMLEERCDAQALLLLSGSVIICGGRPLGFPASMVFDPLNIGTALAGCEVYNPLAGTWAATGAMTYARAWPAAVLLPDDQVLVIGGWGYEPTLGPGSGAWLATAEIYDERSGRWYPTGSMLAPRVTTTLQAQYLPGRNQVIVFGGANTLQAEIYDVATRTWSRSPAVAAGADAYDGLTSAVTSGLVLVPGGYTSTGSTTAAHLYVGGSDCFSLGGLNALQRITAVPTSTTLQFNAVPGYTLGSASVYTPVSQEDAITIPGPYVFDPHDGVAITGVTSVLTEGISAGSQYKVLKLTAGTASDFPDNQGWLCLGFGTKLELAPVKYLGRANPDELLLHYSQSFPQDLPAGTAVTLLQQKGPFNPVSAQTLGSFYLTDSSSGRVAASSSCDALVAAGISLLKTVVYPGDRGLGGEGLPSSGVNKLSDAVTVWAGNGIDAEAEAAREA